MIKQQLGELAALKRDALIDFSIGMKDVDDDPSEQSPLKNANDLFEWLRTDPLDSDQVQTSWVAEAVSCLQQYIHAVYQKLEPGYQGVEFDKKDLRDWDIASNYPVWSASQLLKCLPEDYITPYARIRKTSLFKTLENNLSQARLTIDSVQRAVQEYLRGFEETCNLEVLTAYMDGNDPRSADYYFVGRERIAPHRSFWRRAEIQLEDESVAVNPTAWSEWQPADIPADEQVLDSRLVWWDGRLCLVWVEWREALFNPEGVMQKPYELEIKVAFVALNGQWSSPIRLHSAQFDQPVSAGCRLVAVALRDEDETDPEYPKGRLAVHLTNGTAADPVAGHVPVEIYETRDSLFRKVADERPVMDHLAHALFVDPVTVQQRVLPSDYPSMSSTVVNDGTLIDHYSLKVYIVPEQGKYALYVQGHCSAVKTDENGNSVLFELTLENGAEGDPVPIKEAHSRNGGWSTAWMKVIRSSFAIVTFTLGSSEIVGTRKFVITIGSVPANPPLPFIHKTNEKGAQFLALNQSGLTLKYVRLNTLIGPELVTRSNASMDAVLDWKTQFPNEPQLPEDGVEPNGPFDGCNGLFFWELFFHLPHLVASRLTAEQRFLEAQQWLHYIFDPQAPAKDSKPAYWRCRPLGVQVVDKDICYEANAPTDPDAIAYSSPRHYQILIFLDYVNNIIAWGDWLYRQLTRDSLATAKLQYVRAQTLMGEPPDTRTLNRWTPATLEELVAQANTRPKLDAFEKNLQLDAGHLPVKTAWFEDPGMIGTERFKLPVSARLLESYELPASRLYNLRHNLTLDGKPLSIPLFSTMDPRDLLRSLAAGGAGSVRPMGGQLRVAAFRWRVLFEAAMRGVQTLQEFGNQVLRLQEQQDRGEQEELQQNHLIELGEFARQVQEENLKQMKATKCALDKSKALADERYKHYWQLYEDHISDSEYESMSANDLAKSLMAASNSLHAAGSLLDVPPKIFGLANGNWQLGGVPRAVAYGIQTAVDVIMKDADKKLISENYRRRRVEWEHARDQATAEKDAIDKQICAQCHAIKAVQASHDQTLRANTQALSLYEFLKKRATNVELFRWLLGQLKTVHFQAYDAVVGLCLSAQAALQAETGEYESSSIRPDVWLDSRHGLTAGDSLRLDLLRMESDYLQRYQRRLELVKVISLRELFDDTTDPQETGSWADALRDLRDKGTLNFKLTQLLFDRDFHDHYCRQISAVEVTLPMVVAPFENARATLLQVGSVTALKPSIQSLEYLHDPANAIAPADVLFNLSSGQQVALSSGLDDTGRAALKPDEGLLNPFENTGAVSRWKLTFPWPLRLKQSEMLASLTDIIVKVRYTAKVGDASFSQKVQALVAAKDVQPLSKGKQS